MAPDGTTPETHQDPQTHLDTDPVNAEPAPETEHTRDTDEDEGRASDGPATGSGSAAGS